MRYLDRDYWEKKEKEKAELKARALSDVKTTSLGETKTPELSKTTNLIENNSTLGILKIKLAHPTESIRLRYDRFRGS